MGKIMEAVFCVFYLIFTSITGYRILNNSKDNKEVKMFGIMTLLLVSGDAFHLVPRILHTLNPLGDYTVALGLGKLVTSITMTIFYLILYYIYELHFNKKDSRLKMSLIALSVIRIVLCLMPQNDWTGLAPVKWGVIRNIPFAIIGIITVVIFFNNKEDKYYKWMWLAVLLSFAFYIPVVLWADVSPIIGMLMLPKTIMYMWIAVMGYNLSKNN